MRFGVGRRMEDLGPFRSQTSNVTGAPAVLMGGGHRLARGPR